MNSSFAPKADCVLYVVSQWVEINSEGTFLYLLAFSLELIPVKIPTWNKLISIIREFELWLTLSDCEPLPVGLFFVSLIGDWSFFHVQKTNMDEDKNTL